jgi:hypothetical protein
MLTASQFRRSTKSDKHDSGKPVNINIPHKDAIAIEPPKKVRIQRSPLEVRAGERAAR